MAMHDVLTRLAEAVHRRKETATWRYHLFLTRCLSQHHSGKGSRSLARLLQTEYFFTILTSNTDNTLELALEEQGLHSSGYRVLSVGRDPHELIAAALTGPPNGICLVKLYPDISSTELLPSPYELPTEIQVALRRYLQRNIIIVGCIDPEVDARAALHSHPGTGIYYIRKDNPPADDSVVQYFHQQEEKQLEDFLIIEANEELDTFFSSLEDAIKNIEDKGPTSSSLSLVTSRTKNAFSLYPSYDTSITPTGEYAELKRTSETADSILQRKVFANEFDVFLCHNEEDKKQVKEIAEDLKKCGILPWLAEWELPPGRPWLPLIEKQIKHIKSAAVFVSDRGTSPWQKQEIYALLNEFANRDCPVIPVLLTGSMPRKTDPPIFLKTMTWVDFNKREPDPIEQLIWGITGTKQE